MNVTSAKHNIPLCNRFNRKDNIRNNPKNISVCQIIPIVTLIRAYTKQKSEYEENDSHSMATYVTYGKYRSYEAIF